MIPWLLAILSIMALTLDKVSLWAMAMFTIPSLLFYFIANYIQESHYVIAAAIDVFVIYGLSMIDRPTRIVRYLAIASLASILINFGGWIAYRAYLDPIYYEGSGIALYAAVILSTLWSASDGHANNNRKNGGFHSIYNIGYKHGITDN